MGIFYFSIRRNLNLQNSLLSLPFIILAVIFVQVLSQCSQTIHHVRFNNQKELYEGTTLRDTLKASARAKWFALREPATNGTIAELEKAAIIAEGVNSGKYHVDQVRFNPTTSVFQQYKAGEAYFLGVEELNNHNYNEAKNQFRRTILNDPQLRYISDISFLLAIAEARHGNESAALAELENFRKYSESVYPSSFYLGYKDTTNLFKNYINTNISDMKSDLSRNHFTRKFPGPAVVPRYYPGHLSHEIYGSGFNPYFNIGVDNNGVPYTRFTLHYYSKFGFELSVGRQFLSEFDDWYGQASYQLYRSVNNKFGVTLSYELYTQTRQFSENIDIQFNRQSPGLEIGYFPDPRFGFYIGTRYYYFNKRHPYKESVVGEIFELWNTNSVYLGATVFLLDYIGLTGQWSNINNFQFGVYLYGSNFFPRWLQL